jgi:hypothetical protein
MMTSNTDSNPSSLLLDLPDDLLSVCMSFVGPGHYLNLAGTCRRFRQAYEQCNSDNFSSRWETIVSSENNLLLFAEETEKDLTSDMFAYWAAYFGRLEILQWLNKERLEDVHSSPFWLWAGVKGLVGGGRLDCFHFFIENGGFQINNMPRNRWVFEKAAHQGRLAFLQHVHEKGLELNIYIGHAAAEGGNLDCLEFLYNNRSSEWDYSICASAARGGHLDCLMDLHGKGIDIGDPQVSIAAARRGHVGCLRYLRDNDALAPLHSLLVHQLVLRNQPLDALMCLNQIGAHLQGRDRAIRTANKSLSVSRRPCLEYLGSIGIETARDLLRLLTDREDPRHSERARRVLWVTYRIYT